MGTVHSFVPASRRFLDPDHVRIASDAFDAALQSLGGKGNALSSHRVRHLLASFIVEHVMNGDEDPIHLALQAVESLDIVEQGSASRSKPLGARPTMKSVGNG